MKMRTIYFDMDGTIADLYGVDNWLDKLINNDATPYEEASPMVDMIEFTKLLIELQKLGMKIGIVSWLSKNSNREYDTRVRTAKRKWLRENVGITFDEVHIVKYGTRKDYIVKDKNGILFDDEIGNRKNWKGIAIDPLEKNINEILKMLLDN